jgi:xylan 1,4-beta-xylosidase
VNAVVANGVRGLPDINAIAARKDNEIEVFVWNYHDNDLPAPPSPIDLTIDGLPAVADTVLTEHFRIDMTHSNAFEAWKQLGSPTQPTEAQYQQLQSAGQLQLLNSPNWIAMGQSTIHLVFPLPRQALSLLRITWQSTRMTSER